MAEEQDTPEVDTPEVVNLRLAHVEFQVDSLSETVGVQDKKLDAILGMLSKLVPTVADTVVDSVVESPEKADSPSELERIMDEAEKLSVSKPKAPSDVGRRQSMHRKVLGLTEHSSHTEPNVVVNVTAPSHTHIYLRSLSSSNIPNFVTALRDYHFENGISLPASKVIDRSIILVLAAMHDMMESDIVQMSHVDLVDLLTKSIKIQSPQSFLELLKSCLKNVQRAMWGGVSPVNHEKFFQKVLHRKERFLCYFSMVKEYNKEFVPQVDSKNGLIHLFLELFDRYYTSAVVRSMPKITVGNYPTVTIFIDKFMEIVKKHYDMSVSIEAVPYVNEVFKRHPVDREFNTVLGDKSTFTNCKESPAVPKPERVASLKSNSKLWDRSKSTSFASSKRAASSSVAHRVSYMEQQDDYVPNSADLGEVGENEEIAAPYCRLDSAYDSDDSVDDASGDIQPVANVQHHLSAIDGGIGCLNFTLHGQCKHGDECKFAQFHNTDAVNAAQKHILQCFKHRS